MPRTTPRPGPAPAAQRTAATPATTASPTAATSKATTSTARADRVDDVPLAQRLLGTDTRKGAGVGGSRILDVLGDDRFAPCTGVRVEGRVCWANVDLARALGFDVPPGGRMTPELERQILDVCAWRALRPDEDASLRETKTFYADRYRGTGMRNEGSARTAFAAEGDLAIKGFGLTPLFLEAPDKDFQHVHGGAPMREGLVEAVWGEVGENLFTQGSSRILAVIDTGDVTVWPDGTQERRALIIRATHQLRPAHMLAGRDAGGPFTERVFVDMARELGLLVEKQDGRGGVVVDHVATMAQIAAKHAKTAAEQLRFRVLHGAMSTGNMMLDARQLDLATMSSLPDTSPAFMLKFKSHHGFGQEHAARIEELSRVWEALKETLPQDVKQRGGVDAFSLERSFAASYVDELQLQMLDAVGFKPGMARALLSSHGQHVREASSALLHLMQQHNGGDHDADKQVVADSVVDVFNLLRRWPAARFADGPRDAATDVRAAMELLRPRFLGSSSRKAELQRKVEASVRTFIAAFDALVAGAERAAPGHYDDVAGMRRSMIARASFENEPMDALYRSNVHGAFTVAIDAWQATGDRAVFTEAIDKVAASSLRNVEHLMRQGGARAVPGGVDLQQRTVDGIDYAVRALDGGKRRLRASIALQGDDAQGYVLADMTGQPHLHRDQIDAMRFRFTTDGWATTKEAAARIVDEGGHRRIVFEIPVLKGDAGRLEGLFHVEARGDFWLKDGASNFRGYTFAVPDDAELAELAAI